MGIMEIKWETTIIYWGTIGNNGDFCANALLGHKSSQTLAAEAVSQEDIVRRHCENGAHLDKSGPCSILTVCVQGLSRIWSRRGSTGRALALGSVCSTESDAMQL